jgi:hypothetical protein
MSGSVADHQPARGTAFALSWPKLGQSCRLAFHAPVDLGLLSTSIIQRSIGDTLMPFEKGDDNNALRLNGSHWVAAESRYAMRSLKHGACQAYSGITGFSAATD